jgi:hypothetical protein
MEILLYRSKQCLQLPAFEYSRCASAEENRIHGRLELPAHGCSGLTGAVKVGTDALYVTLKYRLGENIRGEIAVAAFGSTEWHRDVEAEGHPY